jgi:hypothetical protein
VVLLGICVTGGRFIKAAQGEVGLRTVGYILFPGKAMASMVWGTANGSSELGKSSRIRVVLTSKR